VSKYTDRLIRARVAAAMAPAHQYQPPSVTAATIKPAASKTFRSCEPKSPPQGDTLNSRYERIWAKGPQANARHRRGGIGAHVKSRTTRHNLQMSRAGCPIAWAEIGYLQAIGHNLVRIASMEASDCRSSVAGFE
jgi:hypothetical protein